MTPLHEAAVRSVAARWRRDPVGYAEDYLGQYVTPQQKLIAGRLTEPPYQVLIPAGHGVGKTNMLGCLINWHHDGHDPGIVLATAPTSQSLDTQLFKEVRSLRPLRLGLMPAATRIKHTDRHYVLGLTARTPEAFQGKHESDMLIVFDEATGIPFVFWDRADQMHKGRPGHYKVAAYNPYDPTTAAYAAEQSGKWAVVRLSAVEHPNVLAGLLGGPPAVPAAVDFGKVVVRISDECDFCGETRADDSCFLWPPAGFRERLPAGAGPLPWGWYRPRPDTLFQPQITGQWPSASLVAVWSLAEFPRYRRAIEISPKWPVQIGCDASRFGADHWVFAVRKGTALVHIEKKAASDFPTRRVSKHAADRLRELCRHYAPPGVDPRDVPCLIDDTGGYGSGVTDYPEGYDFHGVVSSEAADRPARYSNRRGEIIGGLRVAADEDAFHIGNVAVGGRLVDELIAELTAIRAVTDWKGRRVIESKDAVKARLGRSPDVADAVGLAWYQVPGTD